MLRAIIVDDEQLSVNRLKRILSESSDIEICQTFLNPMDAYEFVKANSIHVAFLDVDMPEINGMRLSSLFHDLDASIAVVFVSAYDNYAAQAFDMSALDYLMKPVTAQRMRRTLDKINKRQWSEPVQPSKKVLQQTLVPSDSLKVFMKSNIIDLQAFFSISLQLAELLRMLHLRDLSQQNFNPDYITIDSQSGQLTLQPINPSISIVPDWQMLSVQDDLNQAFAYISPEQTGLMKRKIDQRSDLYALGVLYYELLTGELPYQARTANEWFYAHMAHLPTPPRTIKPEVPQIINDLVMKLLSKSADDRYQSAYGLHVDLLRCSDQIQENGIIEPFPLGEIDEISQFRLPEKLYGREMEYQELLNAYERSRLGAMELMLIGGHSGCGKTALIKSIQMPVLDTKGYFISGKFDQLNESIPYSSLIAAFRDLIRQILTENDDQIVEWKRRLLDALGQSGIVLIELIVELTLIIGEQPPVGDLPPAESTSRFQTLFGNFIKVFAHKEHPLVIWLDDLQWADPATLHLIQVLINDPSNKYLFIIGTYRNDEIHERQLVEETFIGNSSKPGTAVIHMNIEALSYLNVIQYVADALRADHRRIEPLADTLYQKTAGNPFNLKQMLQYMYDEKLLYYNPDKMRWDWIIKLIKKQEGYKDVNNLIRGRFNALPDETCQLLRLASCIGNSFNIRMLSMLYEQETERTEQALRPALSEGLVITENDTYVFLHDQVQKAAYDLIPDEEKKGVHLIIGRLMLRYFHSDETDDHLFEVVHHLNLSSELITDSAEIERLARINLQAGRKAKASTAHVLALELLKSGAHLIEAEGWSKHYALYYNLLLESSECEYFCGYFVQAEVILEQLLLHAENLVDRAKVYTIQVTMYAYRKKDVEAVEIALKAMAEIGLNIPLKVSRLSIIAEILFTQLWLTSMPRRLEGLSKNRDPLYIALADIVMAASSSLFMVSEESAVLLFTKYVRMSLKQGNSEAFSFMLGSYASALSLGLKSYKTALRLAETALRYSEKTDSVLLKGRIHFIMGLILQFHRPQQSGEYFEQGGQLCLEGGDLLYAGSSIAAHVITASGDLRSLHDLCRRYVDTANRALDATTLRVLHLTMQYVSLLQNTSGERLTISSENFDDGKLLDEEILNDTRKYNLYYYYTCKLEVYYLYGYYTEAVALAAESVKYESNVMLSCNQRHCFYHALAMMAGAPNPLSRSSRKAINKLIAQMKQWTKVVPDSTLSKYKLMLAELARLDHDHKKAAKLYDQAILQAQGTGYPQDEAIANELAAQYYLSLDKNILAEAYLVDACKAYVKWGANGRVNSLQQRYPHLMTLSFIEKAAPEGSNEKAERIIVPVVRDLNNGLNEQLDLNTLRQASRLLSLDQEEADLLESFLDLAIRNTGAEKGLIMLGRDGRLVVEAEKDMGRNQEKPAGVDRSYSTAVVQYVMRTREFVILDEASQSIFVVDPYIRWKRPRSILCLPIGYPDNRVGVLYLENNLTPQAFTADRLEVLEMIFSRMAYMKLLQSQDHTDEAAEITKVKLKPSIVDSLSSREMDILRLMAEGLSNKEIALRSDITEGTVKSHVFNIYGKLLVKRRVQAIFKARELQLLD
jgi:predicted ATPase/DNA-binding NarL/FixJ family response regulator/GAF domain-containing protein